MRIADGETLMIRGTGRTDFQNGDPRAQYESLFGRLLQPPSETLVFPAHDYKGNTVSTIGEENAFNPRLQIKSAEQHVALMNELNLANPRMIDVAVSTNMHLGLHQEDVARRGWACLATEALTLVREPDVMAVDLRETTERERHGFIPQSLHAPYQELQHNIGDGGILHELAEATGKQLLFYCAFGKRSAMAVQAAQAAGITCARHIQGGIDAWKKAGGALA